MKEKSVFFLVNRQSRLNCSCLDELSDGIISFPFISIKDGPVYSMLKEIREEAL